MKGRAACRPGVREQVPGAQGEGSGECRLLCGTEESHVRLLMQTTSQAWTGAGMRTSVKNRGKLFPDPCPWE